VITGNPQMKIAVNAALEGLLANDKIFCYWDLELSSNVAAQ
jgi:hypothetical protein